MGIGKTEAEVRMERLIRAYIEACNEGDAEAVAACFEPDAVHYFPSGMYGGPFRGAKKIGEKWETAVNRVGSYWTVDRIICDPDSKQAVIEWTHFKTKDGVILRGDEWYLFSDNGLIQEIRAYYASPQDNSLRRLELEGFDYEGRGYPQAPPPGVR